MTPIRMRLYLHDEAPRLGSGWRIVTALIGRKWVRIATTKRRTKITRKLWQEISRTGEILMQPKQRRRRPP
jgi:hypothetical protein